MGQTNSLTLCCCDRDRRASTVLNDALQEKLLDVAEETKTTSAFDDASPTSIDGQNTGRKESSPRGARVVSGMMPLAIESEEDDSSDGRMNRDRLDEEDDTGDDENESPHGTAAARGAMTKPRTPSKASSNAWDLADESSAFGLESVSTRLDTLPSESSPLAGNKDAEQTQNRLASAGSSRDSYSSTSDTMETRNEDEEEEDGADNDDGVEAAVGEAVLRRRPPPRPTSSRIFDDDSDAGVVARAFSQNSMSRGFQELAEQDEESDTFNSYGSESSLSMQSFLTRHDADSSSLSLVESTRGNESNKDTVEADVPTTGRRSPRHSGSKKKGKKRR